MAQHPTTIGRYAIQRPIGHGAMGTVYLAEDPLLKRRLAVKVVRAVGEERDLALDRFKREAEVSAQLNHPNIVTIYDVGEEPKVGPFLAMEYVEGQSLGKHIREGTLDVETCFGLLIQAMRALRAAHRNAIIHRDVKPDNILVSEDGRVKLMDFGIAKTMAPRLTSTGEFLGSPAYSAPELLKGAEPTPSSDRYAFAVTAFELLSGQLPHPGNNVAAVITHVLQEPPVIPSGMPREAANIFRIALAQDPDARYETLMEFLMALIDAYPMNGPAKSRIGELFRHDDHAGDIVPLRRVRRPASEPPGPLGDPRDTGGGHIAPGLPMPGYRTAASRRIELEKDAVSGHSGTSSRSTQEYGDYRRGSKSGIEARTLIRWIIIVLIGGQVFWWIYEQLGHSFR